MRVELTPEAESDIADIAAFLVAEASDAVAMSVVDAIRAKCDRLGEMPYRGRARTELRAGVRSVPHKPYIIFYRIEARSIQVLRVVHGARDVDQLFDPSSV